MLNLLGLLPLFSLLQKKRSLQSLNHACYMNSATSHRGENSKGNSSLARHRANIKPRTPNKKFSSKTSVDVSSRPCTSHFDLWISNLHTYFFSFLHSIPYFITTASNIVIVIAQFGRNWSQAGCQPSKHGREADIYLTTETVNGTNRKWISLLVGGILHAS